MNSRIEIRGLAKSFGADDVLRGISVSFPKKGIVALLGRSGSGKSTLLNILAGIDADYVGSARILGVEWKKHGDASRRRIRLRNIGYVFQNFNLLELETVEMNVLSIVDSCFRGSREWKKRKALDLLNYFGMGGKTHQKANTLSGGEKQRVALARALANDPKILLADEPTGALDQARSEEVFSLLRACGKDRLVIVVTHDAELAERYCDHVLLLQDGRIVENRKLHNPPKPLPPKSFSLPKRPTARFGLGFPLFHAFHLMRAKKWRSLISTAVISVGLSGLGLSTYISQSISDELNAVFSRLVPPGSIVMSPRGGSDSPLGAIYSASFDECEYAIEEYGDMVRDYGTDIHLEYEQWFVDANDFSFYSGVERMRLRDFSARSINEFQWLDLNERLHCYPRRPAIMHWDQVVLGLPYANMFTTCLDLHILRDYQSLGDYVDAHGMELVLRLSNEEFGFEDEELFQVVAVVESPKPCFYHLDHRWNRKVFLDQLRFRSSLTEVNPTPQYVMEIPYLQLSVPPSEFLYRARRDENLAHLIYEPANDTYLPLTFPRREKCDLNRLYLFGADKTGVGFSTLDRIEEIAPEILGRQASTVGSYYSSPDSLAMGFEGKFYLCADKEKAERVVDAYSDLPYDVAFLPGEEIEGTVDGSYFSTFDGVRVASVPKEVKVEPKTCEECLLSKRLSESWGNPAEIYVAAEVGAEKTGDVYVRDIGIAALKVVGTVEDDHDCFYVVDDWTVDFYFECLGMSSFLLEPYGAVFHLKEGTDAKAVVERLEKEFPDYVFANPAEDLSSSLSTVLEYVSGILMVFSAFTLVMSALLFFIVMTITVNENLGEASMFSVLGVSRGDIARCFCAHAILHGFFAMVSSLLTVLGSQGIIKLFLAQRFSSAPAGGLSLAPVIAVCGCAVGFTIFIMLGISVNLRAKMLKNGA